MDNWRSSESVNPNMDWSEPFYSAGVSDEVYFDHWPLDVVSKSMLKDFSDGTPAHFRYRERDQQKQSKQLLSGKVVDCLLTQKERFAKDYAVKPEGIRASTNDALDWAESLGYWERLGGKTKVADNWADFVQETEQRGLTIIDDALYNDSMRVADACFRDPCIREHLESVDLVSQVSAFVQDDKEGWTNTDPTGLKIKGRLDYLLSENNIIIDLKTTNIYDGSYYNFRYKARTFYYDVQAALYSDMHERITGIKPEFYFIVVERDAPYLAAMYKLHDDDIKTARKLYRHWLYQYAQSYKRDDWFGYRSGVIEIKGVRPEA